MNRKVHDIFEVHMKSVHEARLDGIEEGRQQGRDEVAKNLKGLMEDEEISRISGLSLENVRRL